MNKQILFIILLKIINLLTIINLDFLQVNIYDSIFQKIKHSKLKLIILTIFKLTITIKVII